MFSPPYAFCPPFLTPNYSFSIPCAYSSAHCPLTCTLLNHPSFTFQHFSLILNISHVSTSSTYQYPLSASSSIAHFISPSFSPRQWAHPGSLGPLKCIISSKRYPSALTSVLAGCLPSSLNGLINPSWFLDGLDFIVSHSPLSSVHLSSLMSSFQILTCLHFLSTEHLITLSWNGRVQVGYCCQVLAGASGVQPRIYHFCRVNHWIVKQQPPF